MTVLVAAVLALLTASTGGVWPLEPAPPVVGEFAPPGTPYGAGHRGVDLAGEAGQDVRAAAPGRVTFAGALAGRGVVVVDHGTTRTTYEPVDAVVRVGEVVVAGTRIGTLERFGSHCWPSACLHWGLIEGSTYLDPLSLLGAAPVRLLPLFGGPPPQPHELPAAGPVTGLFRVRSSPPVRPVRHVGVPGGRPGAAGRW
jgi:murein DD-endopeptidase MepM/ murein hydrolase activator NlpD